ncbi:asparagine synthase-related protein [Novispirillum itersonii]|uniref:asparagine synthase (glutamine-hydrolyzing) n=1 Tax=Novispirillum itersonii TaxID=189 RepID=A0A7W9ZLH6_NOVIT|nr:asparagine synthase-related protein [Novispirillum itersonii]MBB6212424.1 asparagine synthase (glutamine-hydrolyzing) [Novispirillum itersonii]
MALMGFYSADRRPADASRTDLDRLHNLTTSSHLWTASPHRLRRGVAGTSACEALAVVPDSPYRQDGQTALAYSPGPATDRAGRGLCLVGILFEPDRIADACGLPPGTPDPVLAAAWLDRHAGASPETALNRLPGDYALARWDPQEKTLLLAVAPMATHTLYHHQGPDGLWFASTLALLFRFPGVPRHPSMTGLAGYVSALVLDPAQTIFEDVGLLPPGTLLVSGPRGTRKSVLWQPDPGHRIRMKRDSDYVEAARELLDTAVRVRLRQPRPPAVQLSGGLDSPAIAATMARVRPGVPIDCYTSVPAPSAEWAVPARHMPEERPAVEAIAALHPTLRVQFHASTGPAPFEWDPRPLFLKTGRASILAPHMGWFEPINQAMIADGHTHVMVGNSGNFTLSYDGLPSLPDLIRRGRIDLLARHLPPAARFLRRPLWPLIWGATGASLPTLRALWRRWRGRTPSLAGHSPLRPEAIATLALPEEMARWGQPARLTDISDSRVLRAYMLSAGHARNVEGYAAFRATYGLDVLDPLGDRALVEFCLAIPVEQYLIGGRPRSLARRVLADRLPEQVTAERRIGRQNPEWFQRLTAQREAFAADLETLQRVPLAAELLDLPRLKKLVEDWPADAAAAEKQRLDYETLLARGVNLGRFLHWLDGNNR